jgi:hypothetical protein
VSADEGKRPLLQGRGALLAEDFCRHTGLDQQMVDELMLTGRSDGALVSESDPNRVAMIFDDALPSREALAAMGLPVREDYDPDALRSITTIDDYPDGL